MGKPSRRERQPAGRPVARRQAGRSRAPDALAVLGERWNYLILREIYYGVHRFGALRRALGIAPNILSGRLARLVELCVLQKRPVRRDPDWFEYRLTPRARAIAPAFIAIALWGEEHLAGEAPDPRRLRHSVCGHLTRPRVELRCSACGEPARARELVPEDGPPHRG